MVGTLPASIRPEQRWQMATARARLSEVARKAEREPQWIYRGDLAAAVVVGLEEFARFQEWRASQHHSVAEAFAELRQICREEGYEFEVPPRTFIASSS